jgi:hypothetical protein
LDITLGRKEDLVLRLADHYASQNDQAGEEDDSNPVSEEAEEQEEVEDQDEVEEVQQLESEVLGFNF